MTQYAAIPTKFHGVQFRSRLEARYAALFTLLGWKWDYEPFDAKGYIPDFLITDLIPFIVEVKPIEPTDPSAPEAKGFHEAVEKAIKSGIKQDIVVAGSHPVPFRDLYPSMPADGSVLGVLAPFVDESVGHEHGQDLGNFTPYLCRQCNRVNLRPGCTVTGCEYDGLRYEFASHYYIELLWKAAGNMVQYKGSEAQP